MNVTAAIGYVASPSALIVLKRRSSGGSAPSPAADVASSVGVMYWPALFLTSANVKLFCRA